MSFSKLLIKEIAKVKGFFEIHREKRGWAISDFLYMCHKADVYCLNYSYLL